MCKIYNLVILLFLINIGFTQNVGIGNTSPTNTLHITPQSGINPLRVEGVNQYTTERNLFVIDPLTGIIKHMHIDSLATFLPLTPSTDNQNIDSVVLNGTSLTVYIENGSSSTVGLGSLQDGIGTDSQNIDSAILSSNILSIYIENGLPAMVDLSNLLDGTGTDNQNMDSLTLNGTILTAYIEDGVSQNINLEPLVDSAIIKSEWVDGNLVGLNTNDIYPKQALFNGDTIVITQTGRIGINTITPRAPIEIEGSSHNILFETGLGITFETDSLKTGGWSRGFRSKVGGNTKGNFSHYGSSQTSKHSYITGDETRANFADPDLTVLASNGNVGIGSNKPNTKLEVEIENDTIQENKGAFSIISVDPLSSGIGSEFKLKFYGVSRLNGNTTAVYDSTVSTICTSARRSWHDRHLAFGTRNVERMRITTNGSVGIGTDIPSETLDVNGNARFRSVGSGAYANDLSITADGTLTTNSSDKRLKKNIAKLTYGLDEVLKLNPVFYNWKENENDTIKDIGFIAQEIDEIIPETVFKNKNDGYYGVNYSRVIPVLTKAIQQQQNIINEQEQKIIKQNELLLEIQERLIKIEKKQMKN